MSHYDQPSKKPSPASCPDSPGSLALVFVGIRRSLAKAYVPLEPSYPLPRLRFILEDCQAGSRERILCFFLGVRTFSLELEPVFL